MAAHVRTAGARRHHRGGAGGDYSGRGTLGTGVSGDQPHPQSSVGARARAGLGRSRGSAAPVVTAARLRGAAAVDRVRERRQSAAGPFGGAAAGGRGADRAGRRARASGAIVSYRRRAAGAVRGAAWNRAGSGDRATGCIGESKRRSSARGGSAARLSRVRVRAAADRDLRIALRTGARPGRRARGPDRIAEGRIAGRGSFRMAGAGRIDRRADRALAGIAGGRGHRWPG